MEKITIRPSSISTFVNCNYKWFRHHIKGDPVIPNIRMTVGTAVHKGAEVGYTEKMVRGSLPPLSVMTDAAIETFHEKLKEDEPQRDDTPLNDWEKTIVTDIDLYAPIMKTVTPVAVEKRYEVRLNNPHIESVAGTLDIVLRGGVGDIKTTARKATPSKYALQLSTYALLASKIENKIYNTAEIHNIVHDRDIYVMPLQLKIEQARFVINNMIDKVNAYFDGIASGETLFSGNPASPLCSSKYCELYNECPFVKGGVKW